MFQINLNSKPTGPSSHKQPAALNSLTERSKPELAQWYHLDLFSPVNKTLLQAINNGHSTTRPNLTVELVNHLPPSMATANFQMKQIRNIIKSTKT